MAARNDQAGEQVRDAGEFERLSHTLAACRSCHLLDRLGLPRLLDDALDEVDRRTKLAPAAAIRLVITNLVLGREPLYALGEWAARYDPALLGLPEVEVAAVTMIRSAGRWTPCSMLTGPAC